MMNRIPHILFSLLIVLFLFISASFHQDDDVNVSGKEILREAQRLYTSQHYDSALTLFSVASQRFQKANNLSYEVLSISLAGECLIKLRKIDQAIELLKGHERQAAMLSPSDTTKENYYTTITTAYYHAGNAFDALKYHTKVYDINVSRGDATPEEMIELVRMMGVLNYNSGQLQNAIVYYTEYGDLLRARYGENCLQMSDAYNYMAMVYRYLGEYEMALDYYKKAIENAERFSRQERIDVHPDFASVSPLYNNLANIYHDFDDDSSALAYSLVAMNIRVSDNEENHPALASVYSGLGKTYLQLGDYERSLFYKKKGLAMQRFRYGDKHGAVAIGLKNVGETFFEMGEYDSAAFYYQQSLEVNVASHGHDHPNTADSYLKLANMDAVHGRTIDALANVQEALEILIHGFDGSNIYDNPDVTIFCNVRLQLLEVLVEKGDLFMNVYGKSSDRKDLIAAFEAYTSAVDLAEIIRHDFIDNRSKIYLAKNTKPLYEKCLHAAWLLKDQSLGYIQAALSLMEKNKSRLLFESIQDSQRKGDLNLPDSLYNKENKFKGRIAFIEESILNEPQNNDSAKVKQWTEELFSARQDLEVLTNQLKIEYPNYHSARYASNTLLASDFQKNILDDNEILLEFFTGDSTLYMLSISTSKVDLIKLDASFQSSVNALLQSLFTRDRERYTTNAYAVYSKLIKPLVDGSSAKVEKFIVIPDGIISYIPLETLLTKPANQEGYNQFSYALQDYLFDYHFSAAVMVADGKKQFSNSGNFVGFAPIFTGNVVAQRGLPGNIPNAQNEVKSISRTFEGKLFLGDNATESNFREYASESSLIHLATHAQLDETNPNLSKLFFASEDSAHDGVVYAYELYNLKMHADLVTLSACNTGVGKWREGEGAMSLSRAFAYAGCPSIVTSLWPAQDHTTAEIMKLFYENLAHGMDKDVALRNAKLTFLASADKIKSDPFYWACFILIGNTTPVVPGMTLLTKLSIAGGALLLMVVLILMGRKMRRA